MKKAFENVVDASKKHSRFCKIAVVTGVVVGVVFVAGLVVVLVVIFADPCVDKYHDCKTLHEEGYKNSEGFCMSNFGLVHCQKHCDRCDESLADQTPGFTEFSVTPTLPPHTTVFPSSLSKSSLHFYGRSKQCRTHKKKGKIFFGEKVSSGQFPGIVYLRYSEKPFCTGTLIHPRFVLTAAHCADDASKVAGLIRQGDIEAVIDIGRGSRTFFVESATLHPGYYRNPGKLFVNDIAILKLSRSSTFQKPFPCIPPKGMLFYYESCIAVGYGQSEKSVALSSFATTNLTVLPPSYSEAKIMFDFFCEKCWSTQCNGTNT